MRGQRNKRNTLLGRVYRSVLLGVCGSGYKVGECFGVYVFVCLVGCFGVLMCVCSSPPGEQS